MKKLFFVRSGSTCRMLRILAAAMLLLPVNLQPVRASRQDAGAKSSLTVKMKDATAVERLCRGRADQPLRLRLHRRRAAAARPPGFGFGQVCDHRRTAVRGPQGNGADRTGARKPGDHLESARPEKRRLTPPLPAANFGREIVLQGTVISSADNKPIVVFRSMLRGRPSAPPRTSTATTPSRCPRAKHVTFAFLGYDTKKIAVADVNCSSS